MKIISLMENTTNQENLVAEHGLSLYIETGEYKILFDMGQSEQFYQNALELGVDIAAIDMAILSHGHYDHGGGLRKFLEINQKANIYINEHVFGKYYSGLERCISIDMSLQREERVVITKDYLQIAEGLELSTCKEREPLLPIDSCGLYKEVHGELVPDDFLHEQYLLITGEEKKVLISGCSHKGIVNIVEWFQPDVLIGGFHFSKYSTSGEGVSKLENARVQLAKYDTKYYTCHCTGIAQYQYLKERMQEQVEYLSTGQEIVI